MGYCKKCAVTLNAKFCPKCGERLDNAPPAGAPVKAAPAKAPTAVGLRPAAFTATKRTVKPTATTTTSPVTQQQNPVTQPSPVDNSQGDGGAQLKPSGNTPIWEKERQAEEDRRRKSMAARNQIAEILTQVL
jgi:hypothetical protein